jgi:hypothetical protein
MNGERRLIYYAALFFVVVFWFSSASAFQVCTTTSTGAEIKWRNTSTTYYVNTSGGPANSLPAILLAMQTWTDVATSSFIFIYVGTTTSTAYGSNDGFNIVTFGQMGQNGTLAENSFWYDPTTGEFKDTDIQFNTSYPWATDGSIIAYDVQNVGTHELGHSLCLDDLYGSADTEKTMYGYVDAGETKKRTLDQDDIDGITYLYPSPTLSVAPSLGEAIPSGSSYPMQWKAPSNAENFKLLYSLNNGFTWRLIAKNWTNTSYDWPVPIPRKNKRKCLLKVIGYDVAGLKIGICRFATFSIEVIKLTSPDGGEILTSYDTHTITWRTNDTKNPPVVKVKLFYTKNGGATWKPITTITGSDPGSYPWTVPPVTNYKTKCKVKVVLKDASGSTVGRDASDSYFTILPP